MKSAQEFEDIAYALNEKKLYFAGIFFNETNNPNDITYSIRMDIDNTPVTVENRNRFWFPGPEASFELELRYHRGFIQVQHSVDTAIIKYQTNNITKEPQIVSTTPKDEFADFDLDFDDDDEDEKDIKDEETTILQSSELSTVEPSLKNNKDVTTAENESIKNEEEEESTRLPPKILDIIKETFNVSESDLKFSNGTSLESLEGLFSDFATSIEEENLNRTKRQIAEVPQAEVSGLLSIFSYVSNSTEKVFAIDKEIVYTKQFPYSKYVKDE